MREKANSYIGVIYFDLGMLLYFFESLFISTTAGANGRQSPNSVLQAPAAGEGSSTGANDRLWRVSCGWESDLIILTF